MLPRNPLVGTNSTQLDASFGDPASIVIATDADTRIGDFLAALRRPWWTDAACRGLGITDFYAQGENAKARALQTCGTCPSLLPCREEAIADPHLDHGVRGGMDVAARRNARRNLKAQPDLEGVGGRASPARRLDRLEGGSLSRVPKSPGSL